VRSLRDIENSIANAKVHTNDQANRNVLNDLLERLADMKKEPPADTQPERWRTIMKNPKTRFGAMAAAAIVLAVAFGLSEFLGLGGKSAVIWAQVLEKTEQIPAVVFDMTVEIAYSEGKKLVMPSRNYVAGDYGTRSDISMGGELSLIKYRLPRKKVAYQIRLDRKEYMRIELTDEQAAQGRDTDDPRTWLRMILSGDYTKLGRATIHGVAAEGIECNRPDIVGQNGIMRLWVDVETNLPVQIQVEMLGMEGGQMRQHKYVMGSFEWNAELDESVFEPNIPDDFTPREAPQAARAGQSTKTEQAPPRAPTEQDEAQ